MLIVTYICPTVKGWSKEIHSLNGKRRGAYYTVTWGRDHNYRAECEYDFACTCEDYAYQRRPGRQRPHPDGSNPRYCKHINHMSKEHHCGWTELEDAQHRPAMLHPVLNEMVCPLCERIALAQGFIIRDENEGEIV